LIGVLLDFSCSFRPIVAGFFPSANHFLSILFPTSGTCFPVREITAVPKYFFCRLKADSFSRILNPD
jgi:hypothetical protein